MKRGRPFEPGNKFGRGRPPGSRNKRTLLAQKIFQDNSAALMGLAIMNAREDRQLLRLLVSSIVPRRRELPVKVGSLTLNTLEDLDRTSEAIFRKASAGKIRWSEAAEVSAVIETRRRLLETRELERRVSTLESAGGLRT